MALPQFWPGAADLVTTDILANRPDAGAATFGMHFRDSATGQLYLCWQTSNAPTFAWIEIAVGPAGGFSFSIYRQGAASASPPVYGSFAKALAALLPGGVLYIDPVSGPPVTTPGHYDLNGITLAGFWPAFAGTNLDIVTGTTFANMGIVTALRLTTKSANPVITGSQSFWFQQYSGIVVDPSADAPFYRSGPGDNIFIGMSNVSYLWSQKPGVPCMETGAGTASATMDLEQCQINANSLGGVFPWAMQVESPSSFIDLIQLGPYTMSLYGKSQLINYTPAVPGNWAGAAPTTVQQALDRIAAKTPGA